MFGSNDDKKAPAEAGEKKGLFGWFRKKPQPPAQADVPTEKSPAVQAPAPATPDQTDGPAPLAEQAAPAVAPTAEPTPPVQVTPAPLPEVAVPVAPAPVADPAPHVPAPAPAPTPAAVPEVEVPAPVSNLVLPVAEELVALVPDLQAKAPPVIPDRPAPAPAVQPVAEPAKVDLHIETEAAPSVEAAQSEPVKAGFFARLKQGLSKTSASIGEGMASLFLGKKVIDDDLLDEIETRLLTADVGVEATSTIVQNLTQKVARKQLADADALYKSLQEELAALLRPVERQPFEAGTLRAHQGARPELRLCRGPDRRGSGQARLHRVQCEAGGDRLVPRLRPRPGDQGADQGLPDDPQFAVRQRLIRTAPAQQRSPRRTARQVGRRGHGPRCS